MLFQNPSNHLCKALFQRIFILTIQPKDCGMISFMTFRIRNGKLNFADPTEAVENSRPTDTITVECLTNFAQLLLSRNEMFGFRDFK
jgi:hypothetical protein